MSKDNHMELFLEVVFTIAFSLLFSFFIAKLLSIPTTDDGEIDFTGKKTAGFHKFQRECGDYNWDTESKLGFSSKFVELDESIDDRVFTQQENEQRQTLVHGEDEKTAEKSPDEAQENGTETGLMKEEVGMEEKEEIGIRKSEIDSDDWEGIERSETERIFGAAVAYVDSAGKISSLISSDLKLQFYGLYQVAMSGPCYLPQPMALKLSARAKWNAWQQLGNMSSEEAMEHYINLLSKHIPGWMEDKIEIADFRSKIVETESSARWR